MTFSWMIAGKAGYGVLSAGELLAKIFVRSGYNAFVNSEYPSLIKGGHNTTQVRIDDGMAMAPLKKIDLLVALNDDAINFHLDKLNAGAGVIYDSDMIKDAPKGKFKLYAMPMMDITKELGVDILMRNMISIGATIAVLDYDANLMKEAIRHMFKKKNLELNIKSAMAGYNHIKKNYKSMNVELPVKKRANDTMLLNGNDALALGAIKAGCKFVAAYPMTPTTTLFLNMVKFAKDYNIVVKQTEDEIAAIHMCLGASFTGVRTLNCTSGGGFSLMTEALGLQAVSETPLVVVEGQRPGPSTGLPTRTGQGDMRFVLHASQDDIPRIVIAPGDLNECFYKMFEAFNLAEKYQILVIVLVDKQLCDSMANVEKFDTVGLKIDRGRLLSDAELQKIKEFKRYEFTADGVSRRSIPLQIGGIFRAGGDEHDESGAINENEENRVKMVDKRFKKLETAKKELPAPKLVGDKDAEITIIATGSTKGPILHAMKLLNGKANYLQIIYLSPFHSEEVRKVIEGAKKTIVIEGNKTGQLASIIKEHTGKDVDYKFLKYDGRQFFPEEIADKIKEVLRE